MAAFDLSDLTPMLLEKVITKFEKESYFRLQQTCRGMYEFVRRSRNISIQLEGFYRLSFTEGERRITRLWINSNGLKFDDLYGTRLETLDVADGQVFEHIYDAVRKNKMTCKKLQFNRQVWTKEQILAFLKIVKPVDVSVFSEGSDRFEGLLPFRQLESVFVFFGPEDVASAIPKLLSTFPSVKIHTQQGPDPVKLLRSVLQSQRSRPDPKFDKFDFSAVGVLDWSAASMEEAFREFGLVVEEEDTREDYGLNENGIVYGNAEVKLITASMELPGQYPSGGICEVRLEGNYFLGVTCFGPNYLH